MARAVLYLAAVALLVAIAAMAAQAQKSRQPKSLKDDWALFPLWEKIATPTAVRFTPDGEVFIIGRAGVVYWAKSVTTPRPVLVADFNKEVFNNFDRGLTGLAIDPEWPKKKYVYVLYGRDGTMDGPTPKWNDLCDTGICEGSNAVARMTWDEGQKKLLDFTNIVIDWCICTTTHQVGDLRFDKSGNLIMSAGDMTLFDNGLNFGEAPNLCKPVSAADPESGGSMQAQTVGNPVGKVVFISKNDLDTWDRNRGTGGNSTFKPALRPHAVGFRNPYRFCPDPETGEIFLGDVGFADWEELNHIEPIKGDSTTDIKNYGWPCFEGPMKTITVQNRNFKKCNDIYSDEDKMTKAVFQYNHADTFGDVSTTSGGQSAITGVAIYSGSKLPADLHKSVWFVDYTRNAVWAIPRVNGQLQTNNIKMMLNSMREAVDVIFGPDDALYITQIWEGKIWKFMHTAGAGVPPIARIKDPKNYGPLGTIFMFDASASMDPLKGTLTYEWDFEGNGNFVNLGPRTSYVYKSKAAFTGKLKLTSSKGGSSETEFKVFPGYEIKADIKISVSDYAFSVGDKVEVKAEVRTETNGGLKDEELDWTVMIAHCYPPPECKPTLESCHSHLVNNFKGPSYSFTAPDHEYPSYLTFKLEATHPEQPDLKVRFFDNVFPRSTVVRLDTNPPGLYIMTNLVECKAPCSYQGLQMGNLTAEVSRQQMAENRQAYEFKGWNYGRDRGSPHQVVTLEKNETTWVANFEPITVGKHEAGQGPSAPTILNVGQAWRKCTVSWQAPQKVDPADPITNYIVYYRESKFMQSSPLGDFKTHMVPGTANSWDLTGVDIHSFCEFQVAAVTAKGEGDKSQLLKGNSRLVPPAEVYDCPEKTCQYKGALIDDWNHAPNPKNYLALYQEPDGEPQLFEQRNNKLHFRANQAAPQLTYWYSMITDPNAQCFDVAAYYTHLVFRIQAPSGTDFGIGLHSRDNACKEYVKRKTTKLSKYATMDGSEQIVKIPISDLSHNPHAIVSVFFDAFANDNEIIFDDLGFINVCAQRQQQSDAVPLRRPSLFAMQDPQALWSAAAAGFVAAGAMIV